MVPIDHAGRVGGRGTFVPERGDQQRGDQQREDQCCGEEAQAGPVADAGPGSTGYVPNRVGYVNLIEGGAGLESVFAIVRDGNEVPAPQRTYGYYVFPILEGDRLIGRIDMKADRPADALQITAVWPEPGISFGKGRLKRLEGELDRQKNFGGLSTLRFEDGWLREPIVANSRDRKERDQPL